MPEEVSPSAIYSARIEAANLLLANLTSEDDLQDTFNKVSNSLKAADIFFSSEKIAADCYAYGALIEIAGLLHAWRKSVLEADSNSDRYLKAAKAKRLVFEGNKADRTYRPGILNSFEFVNGISEIREVSDFFNTVAAIPISFGFNEKKQLPGKIL